MIDEYDAPVHAGFNNQYYKEIINFTRNFLCGGLKDTGQYLEKVVITGIMRIAQESIFSGLNNPGVFILLSEAFSDKFGFTEKEIGDRQILILKMLRTLEYLPDFFKRIPILIFNRKLKKILRLKKLEEIANGDEKIYKDGLSSEKFEEYMEVLSTHILPLNIIKSQILAILVETSERAQVTAEEFGKMTKSKATVVKIPGDHSTLWERPYVEKLAEVIIDNI